MIEVLSIIEFPFCPAVLHYRTISDIKALRLFQPFFGKCFHCSSQNDFIVSIAKLANLPDSTIAILVANAELVNHRLKFLSHFVQGLAG